MNSKFARIKQTSLIHIHSYAVAIIAIAILFEMVFTLLYVKGLATTILKTASLHSTKVLASQLIDSTRGKPNSATTDRIEKRLQTFYPGYRFSVFAHPDSKRTDLSHPQDSFSLAAVQALIHNPNKPIYEFNTLKSGTSLKYAVAFQNKSCLQCHESTPFVPASFSNDWIDRHTLNILEISHVLPVSIEFFRPPYSYAWVTWLIMHSLVLVVVGSISWRLRHVSDSLTLALRSRDNFISIASHELKTPLNTLSLRTEILDQLLGHADRSNSQQTISDSLRAIRVTTFHLSNLIDNLLDVTRIQSGSLVFNLESFDLVDAVKSVVNHFEAELKRANCELHLDLPTSAVGKWDRVRLEQVITNLLTNAMKYGSGKPIHISLSLMPQTSQVELRIRDEGVGMEPSFHQKIFSRFARADSASGFSGLGLGLYICKEIIEKMGGTISVSSEIGKGSEFIVRLKRYVVL